MKYFNVMRWVLIGYFIAPFITYTNDNSFIFPSTFLKGVSFSSFQNGGDKWGISNWGHFEDKKHHKHTSSKKIKKYKHEKLKATHGAEFWDHAFTDIDLIKHLGCNAVRFSVEWASIEPEEGLFNEEALQFYADYCDRLLAAGIQPTITFHHFTHPHWFEQRGGFAKSNNIKFFIRFCTKVFERLHDKVTLWYTFNEPTVYSFMGYILGHHAPGKFMKFKKAGTVLKNMLIAHVQTYQVLKALPGGSDAQIGLVHQVLKAQPYSSWYPTGKFAAGFLNCIAAHKTVYQFLKTGIFHYKIPGIVTLHDEVPEAPSCYDFIGINYYSRVVIAFKPTCYPHEIMTDMEYAIYPQGIYDTIVEMSELGVPMYITENGIADALDNRREYFIKEYLSAVHRALEQGYDIRGYFYWTLMDNFEWDRGFTMKFGLYHVDLTTKQRTLRQGAHVFRDKFNLASVIA